MPRLPLHNISPNHVPESSAALVTDLNTPPVDFVANSSYFPAVNDTPSYDSGIDDQVNTWDDLMHHYRRVGDYENIKVELNKKKSNNYKALDLQSSQQELYELMANLSSSSLSDKKQKVCKFCKMKVSNLYRHLRKANHSFKCTENNCRFISLNIKQMKDHLFHHFLHKM